MSEETKRVRVVNHPTTLWTVGYLFTLGYTSFFGSVIDMSLGQIIGKMLLTLILWPFLLGETIGAP